ncbi:hypothetical protein FJ941_14060 [Mesorhizobium sp. B2-3-13]|uniref:hypothetical protein n=1 Tax=Mesorhizobium sp. B2-3-13 TaxID=2589951 RepID=UPI00112D1C2E|nr:hypothetical protein [Mesorhizobium sp. B2-3-13]TPL82005.1 hypothetical protein FJ941_14060 [Mesorhizobium sp. B2-3-13]
MAENTRTNHFIKYWRDVLHIAWRGTWSVVMRHSAKDIFRDIVLLALTAVIVWQVSPILVRDRLMSADNLKDTLAWAIFVTIAITGLFSAVFVCHALVVSPYQKWRDKSLTKLKPILLVD